MDYFHEVYGADDMEFLAMDIDCWTDVITEVVRVPGTEKAANVGGQHLAFDRGAFVLPTLGKSRRMMPCYRGT